MSYYHHLVGLAMIANARANERINQSKFAISAYRAVIAVFTSALARDERNQYRPINEDLISIQCLDTAVHMLIEIEPTHVATLNFLSDRIQSELTKENDPDIIEGPV